MLLGWCLGVLGAQSLLVGQTPRVATTPLLEAGEDRDEPSMLHVEGDAEQLFLVLTQSLPQPGPGSGGRTLSAAESGVVYRRGVGSAVWQFMGVVAGRPRDVAIWRGQLAVLMTDGTWRTVYEGGSSAGVRPTQGQLLRLTGDGNQLFGLLRTSQGLQVGRLTGGGWEILSEVPAGVSSAGSLAIDLAVRGSELFLAWRGEEASVVEVATRDLVAGGSSERAGGVGPATDAASASGAGGWVRRPACRAAEPVLAVRWLGLGDRLWLWSDPGTTSGGEVFTWEAEGRWRGFSLGADPGEAAGFAGRIRLFFRDASAATRPGFWQPTAGVALLERVFTPEGSEEGSPQRVDLGTQPGQPEMLKLLAVGLAMGGLMSALLMSWRRRAELSPGVVMAAFRLPLASRFKRLAAGLVDAAPFVAVSAYVVASEGLSWSDYLLTPRVMFYELLGIALVVTHTTLAEVVAGRSLGKALFGLRVTDFEGKRPPTGRLVLRSVFRAVDLMLIVPLLTVAISPLRQSIGDGAAGTVVLEEAPDGGSTRQDDAGE